MASHCTQHFSINQVLGHIFQGGFDNEGKSMEEEMKQEDEEFLCEDRTHNLSPENTRPALGPAHVFVFGASVVVPADTHMFNEDTDIEDEDDRVNGDSEVGDTTADSDSDNPGVYEMETDIDAESDTDMESEVDHPTLPWGRNLDGFPSIPRFRGKNVYVCVCRM